MRKKARTVFLPTSLIFKLQRQVLKFNDICGSCCSPKTDIEKSDLEFENPNFGNVGFF